MNRTPESAMIWASAISKDNSMFKRAGPPSFGGTLVAYTYSAAFAIFCLASAIFVANEWLGSLWQVAIFIGVLMGINTFAKVKIERWRDYLKLSKPWDKDISATMHSERSKFYKEADTSA